jgi:hypothetical protein
MPSSRTSSVVDAFPCGGVTERWKARPDRTHRADFSSGCGIQQYCPKHQNNEASYKTKSAAGQAPYVCGLQAFQTPLRNVSSPIQSLLEVTGNDSLLNALVTSLCTAVVQPYSMEVCQVASNGPCAPPKSLICVPEHGAGQCRNAEGTVTAIRSNTAAVETEYTEKGAEP